MGNIIMGNIYMILYKVSLVARAAAALAKPTHPSHTVARCAAAMHRPDCSLNSVQCSVSALYLAIDKNSI